MDYESERKQDIINILRENGPMVWEKILTELKKGGNYENLQKEELEQILRDMKKDDGSIEKIILLDENSKQREFWKIKT